MITRRACLGVFVGAAAALTGCAEQIAPAVVVAPSPTPPSAPPTPAPIAMLPPAPEKPRAPESPKGDGPLLPIPARDPGMETGTRFLARTAALHRVAFEREVVAAFERGNVPTFERRLLPIQLTSVDKRGGHHKGTAFVLCDYLAIGSDADFMRIPMTPGTAQRIATLARCVLPTRHVVDEVYRQAAVKLPPKWIDGGPDVSNRVQFASHNGDVEAQRAAAGCHAGDLTAGDKKDIVVSNRLVKHPGRVCIYGWHRAVGRVIQKLSTAHVRIYADYSHGVRLISDRMLVEGVERSTVDVMRDPLLCGLVSDEGPIQVVAYPVT